MKKEIIEKNVSEETCNFEKARKYVKGNTYISDKSRTYIFQKTPAIIKEITIHKVVRFWCFLDDRYIIYEFKHLPDKDGMKEFLGDYLIYKKDIEVIENV